VLVHGGPGAPGTLASLARGLAARYRVLEPYQRRSGPEPLTVAHHVADLHDLIAARCPDEPPVVVGSSWGAMLALAHAAAHPGDVRGLVLVGCGTFDPEARERFRRTVAERMTPVLTARYERLANEIPDPDERLAEAGRLFQSLYAASRILEDPGEADAPLPDARGHTETWYDMLRLQAEGVYPAAFAAITAPVVMLHGEFDPHPGRMIAASLRPHLPQLEYVEIDQAGHEPWREQGARRRFLVLLYNVLGRLGG
jgi:pimeloyl-ACP methyl ester carboxylesterase